MNLDCFYKDKKCFIGLRYSCNCADPSSGLFFNDLEGMSLKRVSTVAGEENHKGEDLFKTLEKEALQEVVNDFKSKLCESYNFNHTIQKRLVGKVGKNTPDELCQKGGYFERYNDDCHQKLKVSRVSFNSDRAIDSKMFIETPCGIEEKEVNIKCGYNVITIDLQTSEDWVCITFDNNFKILEGSNSCGCGNVCDSCDTTCGCFKADLFNVYFEEKQYSYNNGLKFDVSCICDDTPILCEFADDLKFAVRYKIGVKLMTEALVSDNQHPLIYNGKDDAQMLLTKWQGGVNRITGFEEKSDYWRVLMPVVKKAKQFIVHLKTPCVTCEHTIKYIEQI